MPASGLLDKPMSPEQLRDLLARQIEDAFADTPYPGDEDIIKADSDGDELEAELKGKSWRNLDIIGIANHHVDMAMLTAEAFRFYVPGFMLAVMYHYQHVGTLPMSLIHNLTPPDSSLLQKYIESRSDTTQQSRVGDFLNRVSVLSSKEKTAIRAFLETYDQWCTRSMGEQRSIQRALEFWTTI